MSLPPRTVGWGDLNPYISGDVTRNSPFSYFRGEKQRAISSSHNLCLQDVSYAY